MWLDLGVRLVLGRELVEERFDFPARADDEDVGREEFWEPMPSEKPESCRPILTASSLGEGKGSGSAEEEGGFEDIFCSGLVWMVQLDG